MSLGGFQPLTGCRNDGDPELSIDLKPVFNNSDPSAKVYVVNSLNNTHTHWRERKTLDELLWHLGEREIVIGENGIQFDFDEAAVLTTLGLTSILEKCILATTLRGSGRKSLGIQTIRRFETGNDLDSVFHTDWVDLSVGQFYRFPTEFLDTSEFTAAEHEEIRGFHNLDAKTVNDLDPGGGKYSTYTPKPNDVYLFGHNALHRTPSRKNVLQKRWGWVAYVR